MEFVTVLGDVKVTNSIPSQNVVWPKQFVKFM